MLTTYEVDGLSFVIYPWVAFLIYPLILPHAQHFRSEQLLVTVDTHTGIFLSHVPQYEDNPFTKDIQSVLNDPARAGGGGSERRVETLVSQLRFWITMH